MEFVEEDYKTISKAIIVASNLTETEWLNMEKSILESHSGNGDAGHNVLEMWNQLYCKIECSMKRMKENQ